MKDLKEGGKSNFSFTRSEMMMKAKVDLKRDDILINYTTEDTMLMNKVTNMPWRGAREKDPRLMQFIIEATREEDDVVFDCTTSTG